VSSVEASGRKVDLATEPDFRVGGLTVIPSTCRVRTKDTEVRIEPRTMEVLVALWRSVEKTVTRDQLAEACWDARAVSDDAIARVIAKIRQLAAFGGGVHFTVETLPKVGFRLLPVVPPAVVQAATDTASPLARLWPRWVWLCAIGAMILLLGGGILWSARSPAGDGIAPGQVGIIPLTAMQSNPSLSRLARNINAALARHLMVSGLPPASNGAEFAIGGTIDDTDATTYVDAWIRDSRSGLILWSHRFERPVQATTGLEDRIAGGIAYELTCGLTMRQSAHGPLDARVMSLILGSCSAVPFDTEYGLEETRRLVLAAPDLGAAHALRALALADYAGQVDHFGMEERMAAGQARAEAQRALALDPSSALAHVALGLRIEPDFAVRERHLQRAIALNPDLLMARAYYAIMLRETGQLQAAEELYQRMADSSDASLKYFSAQIAFLHAMLGSASESREVLDRLDIIYGPETQYVHWTIDFWWDPPHRLGADDWRLASSESTTDSFKCLQDYMVVLLAANGRNLRGLPSSCSRLSEDEMPADWHARLLAREGDVDGAFAVLGQEIPNSRRGTMFLFYPEMRSVRRDPRFFGLAEKFGLKAYWKSAGVQPDFCREEDMVSACAAAIARP